MQNDKIRKHLKITGRVQGVGYRYFTRKNAEELNVNGWVKNMPDGSVETMLSGHPKDVEELIERLWKGPYTARVKNIDLIEKGSTEKEELHNFYVKR